MQFVGYSNEEGPRLSAPSASSPSHPSLSSHPSHPHPPRSLRADTLDRPTSSSPDSDAVESHLRALYTRALVHTKQRQPQLASPLYLQLLSHPSLRRLHRGDASPSSLPRRLLHLHFLALKSLAGLYEESGEPQIALQCYAFTALSSPPLSPASLDVLQPLRVQTARCALRVGHLALARALLEEVWALAPDAWDVTDALMDALYCVGDVAALAAVARRALRVDRRCVKALLVQAQVQALVPAPVAFHQRCVAELALVPPAVVQAVAQGLLDAAAASHADAEIEGGVAPATVGREEQLTSLSLAELAETLLRLYKVAEGKRPQAQAATAVPTFPSLHRLLRWLKQRQATSRDAKGADVGSALPASPSTKSPLASFSLTSPVVLVLPSEESTAPEAVSLWQSREQRREESRRQRRRDACVRVVRQGLLGGASCDRVAEQLEELWEASLAADGTAAEACTPSTSTPAPPSSSAAQPSTVADFVSEHAASAASNAGVVDLMQRLLRWVRLTRQRSVSSDQLGQVVLALLPHLPLDAVDDEEELLFSAAVLLDCLAAPSSQPSALPAKAVTGWLSTLWSRLSLAAVTARRQTQTGEEGSVNGFEPQEQTGGQSDEVEEMAPLPVVEQEEDARAAAAAVENGRAVQAMLTDGG